MTDDVGRGHAGGTPGTPWSGASSERLSTGVPRLDRMLSGGLYRGSTALVSGASGTGKTTLGAHLIDAACARGERALLILFEEAPDEVLRNMRSVGLDLGRWVEAGLLRIWAARPAAFGLETRLTILARLIDGAKTGRRRSRRDDQPGSPAHPGRHDLDGGPPD